MSANLAGNESRSWRSLQMRQRRLHHALAEFSARHLAVVIPRERGGVEAVIVLRDELFRAKAEAARKSRLRGVGALNVAFEGVVVKVTRRVHAGAETSARTGDVVARHLLARRAYEREEEEEAEQPAASASDNGSSPIAAAEKSSTRPPTMTAPSSPSNMDAPETITATSRTRACRGKDSAGYVPT